MVKTKSRSLRSVAKADNEHALASWEARRRVVLHATLQLESVLVGIREIARKTSDKDLQGRLLALAMRARDLTEVVTCAMADDSKEEVVEAWRTLNTDDFGTGTEAANG